MTICVGVDGGGTGCRAAICDGEGRVLGQGSGPAANVATSPEGALASVRAALEEARIAAGLSREALENGAAWVGLAGLIDPGQAERLRAGLTFRRLEVSDDRPTGMVGALGGRDGCLAAIGTGSFIGRQAGGARGFVGGWGWQISDQASGAWLGRGLLSRLADWQDGMATGSPLLERVLEQQGGLPAAVFFSLRAVPADYGRLARQVVEAAGEDPAARDLMQAGADWILRALAALEREAGEPVCLIGGIGPHYAPFLPEEVRAALVAPEGSPLDGALRLARGLAQG